MIMTYSTQASYSRQANYSSYIRNETGDDLHTSKLPCVHYSGITLYQTHMTHDTYTYDKNSQLNTSLLAGDMQFECC